MSEIKFEVVRDEHRKCRGDILLPKRMTKGSAGYDFFHNGETVSLLPNESAFFWTDVKVKLPEDKVLFIAIRSSLAVKWGIVLLNSLGIIDSDFFSNEDNDGNIGIFLHNTGRQFRTIEKGMRIAQGIILPYFTTDDDECLILREGGIGSTAL